MNLPTQRKSIQLLQDREKEREREREPSRHISSAGITNDKRKINIGIS